MYEKILLPVDESTATSAVLYHASELAHWDDAEIQLLFVADTTRDSVTVVSNDVVDALEREGESVVEEAAETLDTLGVEYGTDVVQGNPAPTIVEYAAEYDYDLIVMPTHGRQGLSRQLHGSVTEKVVRLSDLPVLTARMDPDDELTFPYERILIPTDGSRSSKRATTHGLQLAAALDAAVHILSVVDDSALGFDVRSMLSGEESEQGANEAIGSVVSEATDLGITKVVERIEHGTPSDEIRAYVEDNDIHAVVMGTTGRSGVDRILLGSVAEQTVRTAPVPVITLSPGE
ncbi:universal stress protein (plasmid) [Haloferax mediterranei ATCC 33500]|uniref:Stress response protein n=1 Tax=Haloferax mediterranei (strain ATCC 33500 / DSM 1411 / JCM 8866 / NBRC 14739 / NCIMB 2177 / R-4) TaxID=523841 RepID=I3RBA8_HALMT|nr:universal stress protein [Haloferax mediterranei]AFK21518.1 stress response protein [Haloferax mediterranei ATCC 33500]AHZ24427.1 universal stress protein UspA [Haloferax mediterranei ATCC 33500]ELZ97168.1 stress response protein [Haloferax mediterranei ATCC 33500]MDX5990088.1 universal stress protein [Haloferax mediterranei ATCC 33500]QCQ76827.1 universal stress protein [Haloferax mediterranei ATCC 33500]